MDTEHLTAVCTGLGSLREDSNGRDVYVKHDNCLGMYHNTLNRCLELCGVF